MNVAVGEYQLKRQAGGVGAYAFVRVEVRPRGAGQAVEVDLGDDERRDEIWCRAAVEGCQDALQRLLSAEERGARQAVIVAVGGMVVDTTEDAMRAAATMATADALGMGGRVALRKEDDGWRVEVAMDPFEQMVEGLGLGSGASFQGLGDFLPLMERVKDEGAVFLLKLDGQRTAPDDNGPYTILISGGPLGDDFVRRDVHDLVEGLRAVFVEYQALGGFAP